MRILQLPAHDPEGVSGRGLGWGHKRRRPREPLTVCEAELAVAEVDAVVVVAAGLAVLPVVALRQQSSSRRLGGRAREHALEVRTGALRHVTTAHCRTALTSGCSCRDCYFITDLTGRRCTPRIIMQLLSLLA